MSPLDLRQDLTLPHGFSVAGSQPYGVRFNFVVPNAANPAPPTGTAGRMDRLGVLAEYNNALGALEWTPEIGAKCTIQSRMRRCVMVDAVNPMSPQDSVAYYLDPDDSTKKADGTAADLTGGDGQVMVEIPKFYQKVVWDEAGNPDEMEWWISEWPMAGYSLHPAFLKIINNTVTEVPFRYIGAYTGVLQDSDGVYQDYYDYTGTHIRTIPAGGERQLRYATDAKLASVAGFLPVAQGTRAEFRAAARRRDGNTDDSTWRLTDWSLWSAVQLLLLVEYASFNSQKALTNTDDGGLNNLGIGTWSASVVGGSSTYLPIVPTGGTETLGNHSGAIGLNKLYGEEQGLPVFNGSNNIYWDDVIPCYRGIEVPYGHMFQWLDGINLSFETINRLNAFVSSGNFIDNTTGENEDYRQIIFHAGANNVPVTTCPARIQEAAGLDGFYPREGGGGTTTGLTDYYYSTSSAGARVVAVGGAAFSAGAAGVFCVYANDSSGSRRTNIGGRLCL